MSASALSFALCDLDGNLLVDVEQREGTELVIPLNDTRTCRFNINREEQAALYISPGDTMLKGWLDDQIIFTGLLQAPVIAGDTIQVASVDFGLKIQRAFIYYTYYHFHGITVSPAFITHQSVDLSDIMWGMIANFAEVPAALQAEGVRQLGVRQGTLAASSLRDRKLPEGKNVWEAVVELSEMAHGPDFELAPLDRTDGVHAEFNTYYRNQGADRSATVVFENGFGDESARDLQIEPSGEIVNTIVVAGKARKGFAKDGWFADHEDSLKRYGRHMDYQVLDDIKSLTQLQDHAESVLAEKAYPINYFTLAPVPEGSGPFTFNVDYKVGDSIAVYDGSYDADDFYVGRITDTTLREDANGQVVCEHRCTPRLGLETGIRGQAVSVYSDSN